MLPRKNSLIRPAVANVDQALVVFAVHRPAPNYNLLDRFIVMMEKHDIETVICFSKKDLAKDSQLAQMADIYAGCGCRVHFISTVNKEGIDDIIRPIIAGKTTVFAGPSGVGKSSLTNELLSQSRMETGAVSEKI